MATILDTNLLFQNPEVINDHKIGETIIIPIEVLKEVDKHKGDKGKVGYNARCVARMLKKIVLNPEAGEDNIFFNENGGQIKFEMLDHHDEKENFLSIVDSAIVRGAANGHIVKTADIEVAVLAKLTGNKVEFVDKHTDLYSGETTVYVDSSTVDSVASGAIIKSTDKFESNEFIILIDKYDLKHKAIARYDSAHNLLVPIKYKMKAFGIEPRPKNIEQTMLMNLLMNPEISIVTCLSEAGGGKTLLTIASAVEQVMCKRPIYHKICMFKAMESVGEEMGFLPGDVNEKLDPWYSDVYDAFEFLLYKNNAIKERPTLDYIKNELYAHKIDLGALTFIRGRSIPNCIIIVDEAQNITPDVMRTIVTRCGEGTKLIITGDPSQIDNPRCNKEYNGLTHVIQSFSDKNIPEYGHIELKKCERSKISDLGIKFL